MNGPRRILVPMLLAVLLCLSALLLWTPAPGQDKGKVARVKWEYMVIRAETFMGQIDVTKMQNALNKAGDEGWECFTGPPNLICKRQK